MLFALVMVSCSDSPNEAAREIPADQGISESAKAISVPGGYSEYGISIAIPVDWEVNDIDHDGTFHQLFVEDRSRNSLGIVHISWIEEIEDPKEMAADFILEPIEGFPTEVKVNAEGDTLINLFHVSTIDFVEKNETGTWYQRSFAFNCGNCTILVKAASTHKNNSEVIRVVTNLVNSMVCS
jgi:hypothetical protein